MSQRAAYNFLSSISLGGPLQKKDKDVQSTAQKETQHKETDKQHHHSHRELFKAKFTSTLEKTHVINRHHDKNTPPSSSYLKHHPVSSFQPLQNTKQNAPQIGKKPNATPSPAPITSSSSLSWSAGSVQTSASKPAMYPAAANMKRSTSNVTIANDYNVQPIARSTSGNAMSNFKSREGSPTKEMVSRTSDHSPRAMEISDLSYRTTDPGPRADSASGTTTSRQSPRDQPTEAQGKSRNSSVDHGLVKRENSRESDRDRDRDKERDRDQGIMRKGSDPLMNKGRTSTIELVSRPRGESVDYTSHQKNVSIRRTSEPSAKIIQRSRAESALKNSMEARKLSKSTNDARSPAIAAVYGPRSTSNSIVIMHARRRASSSRSASLEASREITERGEARRQDSRISLKSKSSKTAADEDVVKETKKSRRHKRKSEFKRKPAIKNNPAALDFLKGISLGENTPNLRRRKSAVKSLLSSQVYPPESTIYVEEKFNAPTNTILFAGSSATKKIKIADYAAQSIPGKIYFSTRSSSTFAVFSIIKFDAKANKKETRNALKESIAVSTGKLKNAAIPKEVTLAKSESLVQSNEQEYHPYLLDDPTLTTGKHRTVMNLAGLKASVIPYVRAGVIKDELNELFRQKHPWVPYGVTLHKIRKLKKALVLVAVHGGLEVSTSAIAFTLFEKLVMKGIVTKPLIRLYGAVCLILAAKSNDPRGDDLKATLEVIEKNLNVKKEDIFSQEFLVFAAFSFCLLLAPEQVLPHIRLIIKDHQDLVGNPY